MSGGFETEKREDRLREAAGRLALQGEPAPAARSDASHDPASAPLEHPPRPSQTSQVVIDFHFNVDHAVIHACRVVRKALGSGRTVLVFSRDAQRLARLDSALWTFSALDFLPHVYADSELADRTPVWLSMTAPCEQDRDMLLLLDDEAAPDFEHWFERFERVIEIVSNEAEDRARARARFKAYRERGFAPRSHEIASQ